MYEGPHWVCCLLLACHFRIRSCYCLQENSLFCEVNVLFVCKAFFFPFSFLCIGLLFLFLQHFSICMLQCFWPLSRIKHITLNRTSDQTWVRLWQQWRTCPHSSYVLHFISGCYSFPTSAAAFQRQPQRVTTTTSGPGTFNTGEV